MFIEEAKIKIKNRGSLPDYLEVIKPRETGLLVFIGLVTALLASQGNLEPGRFILTLAGLFFASAGANGLTNYLDRNLDARMERTCRRALPAGRIFPPEKALVYTSLLTLTGLILAWLIHPYAFLVDVIGTAAAVIYRKRITCVFPQGVIAGCAPVLMGWFAFSDSLNWEIGLICVLITVWLPSHIWSIMIAHKQEYQNAGINFFPASSTFQTVAPLLFVFCLLLYAASLGLYFAAQLGWVYLITANAFGLIIVFASLQLVLTKASKEAWRLYKISAFPYLGVLFLALGVDILTRI